MVISLNAKTIVLVNKNLNITFGYLTKYKHLIQI